LVVVLIIGILSSIALPRYQRAVEKARATEAVTQMAALTQAIDRFVLENGYITKLGDELLGSLDIEFPETNFDRDQDCVAKGDNKCTVVITSPKGNYQLYATKYKSQNGKWEKICYWADSAGKGVCEGLTGIGYTSREGSI